MRAIVWRRRLLKRKSVDRKFPRCAAVEVIALVFFIGLIPRLAIAQGEAPIALVPENFSWRRLPNNPALESAWILGDGQQVGPYILRVNWLLAEKYLRTPIQTNEIVRYCKGWFMSASVRLSTSRR